MLFPEMLFIFVSSSERFVLESQEASPPPFTRSARTLCETAAGASASPQDAFSGQLYEIQTPRPSGGCLTLRSRWLI